MLKEEEEKRRDRQIVKVVIHCYTRCKNWKAKKRHL